MIALLRVLEHTPQDPPFDDLDRSRILINEAYAANTILHLIRMRQPYNARLEALAQRMKVRCARREAAHSDLVALISMKEGV